MEGAIQIETKFLNLGSPVEVGEIIDGWQVSWLGGWDKGRVFYVVMVVRVKADALMSSPAIKKIRRVSPLCS